MSMKKTDDKPAELTDTDLDGAAGGLKVDIVAGAFKVEIEGVTKSSFEPVTLERSLVDKSAEKRR